MRLIALLIAALIASLATTAHVQERTPSHCIALAHAAPGLEYIQPVAFRDPVADETVRISYVDHAMFLIQTTGGLSAMTDFTGWFGNVDFLPDIITMNNAHGTHWTRSPDPAIPHVLQGWPENGARAFLELDLGEMLVRNVTTDIRGGGGTIPDGNSIFVFEVAGLCIGHLGHLHHEPTPEQYAALGRMDVVMAAVDGGLTVDLPTMIRVLTRLRSSIVIPMHWFGRGTLEAFLTGMEGDFDIVRSGESSLTVARGDLPSRPTVYVLDPAMLREAE